MSTIRNNRAFRIWTVGPKRPCLSSIVHHQSSGLTEMKPGGKSGSGVGNFLVTMCMLACVLVAAASVLFPLEFRQAVDRTCNALVIICVPPQAYADEAILDPLGYGPYAVGFAALRRLGAALFVAQLIALVTYSLRSGRYMRVGTVSAAMWPVFIACIFGSIWWTLLADDFYFARRGEIRRVLTPPIGTFAYSIALTFTAMLFTGLVAMLMKAIRSRTLAKNVERTLD